MKLSKNTQAILKNFATINSNILFKQGNILSTISVGKTLVAKAELEDSFPKDFGIYDMPEFLGVLSLFEDPDITFEDKYLTINQGKNSIKYYAADESVLVYPKKFPEMKAPELSFNLTGDNISTILKTALVLKTTDVRFVGDGSTLSVLVGDKKNQTANSFSLELGDTDKTFSININTDNMKFIVQDFTVNVIERRMLELTSDKLTYIVAIEKDSSFE